MDDYKDDMRVMAQAALGPVEEALALVVAYRERHKNVGHYAVEDAHKDLMRTRRRLVAIVTGDDPEHRAALEKFRRDYLGVETPTEETPAEEPRPLPRKAFFITLTEMTPEGEFIPCLVTEGVPGYEVLRGNGQNARPWLWGTSAFVAKEVCNAANRDTFGWSSPLEASQFVAANSRLRASPTGEAHELHDHDDDGESDS
jgi:hypothetical protein